MEKKILRKSNLKNAIPSTQVKYEEKKRSYEEAIGFNIEANFWKLVSTALVKYKE